MKSIILQIWGQSQKKGGIHWRKILTIASVILLICILTWVSIIFLPPGIDWQTVYRPAALSLLSGNSPFEISGYYNPPWAAVLLIPLALLPVNVGYGLLITLSLMALAYVAIRLGAKPAAIAILFLSPPVLHGILNGTIDSFAILGIILPPQIGLFFITLKPQIGVGIAIFWLYAAWNNGRLREVIRVFGPITLLIGLTFLVFGFWIKKFNFVLGEWWNATLWPASIPIGLVLLVASLRNRKKELALGASPFLSPHVLLHSWVAALLAVVTSIPELITAVCGLWIVTIFL